MPIRDQAAMERSLDNDYGPTRGPHAPAAFQVALFDGDPMTDGVELTATSEDGNGDPIPNGYARASLSNDAWAPAADGIKSVAVSFPAPTAEWATVTHWALHDPATSTWWDCAPLTEPLEVTDAGPPVGVTLAVFYDDNLD